MRPHSYGLAIHALYETESVNQSLNFISGIKAHIKYREKDKQREHTDTHDYISTHKKC